MRVFILIFTVLTCFVTHAEFYHAQDLDEFWSKLREGDSQDRNFALCLLEIDQKSKPTHCLSLIDQWAVSPSKHLELKNVISKLNKNCMEITQNIQSMVFLSNLRDQDYIRGTCRADISTRIGDLRYQRMETGPNIENVLSDATSNNFHKTVRIQGKARRRPN